MSDRITRTDVDRIAETVSSSLRGLELRIQARNGYYGLDLYDGAGMVDTLTVGTKRELYTYLQGMRRALLITNR
jgi:hypothetical protein